jgi:hypothetical protein
MCNYKYQYQKHHLTGLPCIYPSFYTKYSSEFHNTKELPIDPDGCCIFHSKNKNWKIQNGFSEKFNELLKWSAEMNQKDSKPKWLFNFSGFYFFQNTGVLKLNEHVKDKSLDFTFCEFLNGFTIEDLQIDSIDLNYSRLHDTRTIKNVTFLNNISTFKSTFDNGVAILNCIFEQYHSFNYCTFSNKTSSNCFKITDPKPGYLDFEHSKFETTASFYKSTFNSDVIFDKCTFLYEFIFHDNEVNGIISFKETSFLLSENTNPRYSSVDFDKLKLTQSGALIFLGTEAFGNMVKGQLHINCNPTSEGIISFENFNLNKLRPDDKLKMFELEKSGKVEIGKGCRKYYAQTDIFEIKASKPNQTLILDLVKIFCNYFEIHNSYSLGLEIVERKIDLIKYFFFTDELISKFEFENRVKQNEYDLWQTFANVSRSIGDQLKDNLVEEKNALIDIAAIFLKIRNRVTAINYHEEQFTQFVNSIAIGGKSVIDSVRLYDEIQTRFQSFYKDLPSVSLMPKFQKVMGITNTFNGPVGNIQFGEHSTQNNYSSIESLYQGLFENCAIQNDQKLQVIEQIKDIKQETEPEKKENKLKKFIKEWGPILGETAGKTIKALTD